MKTDQLPETLYRNVRGSRSTARATVVSALQYDGGDHVLVDADRVSWAPRVAALLRELANEAEASDVAQAYSLPYASLRAAFATSVPQALLLERDLGAPWLESPRPFIDVEALHDLGQRLGSAFSLWVALALRPWAAKTGVSEELVDALHELADEAFVVRHREGNLDDAMSSGSFAEARDAIIQRLASALEGRELFDGLGPVWRIIRGRSSSNEIEFTTWPAQHDEALYSMVAGITVETLPFVTKPIVTVRASRRRWMAKMPTGRSLTGQRNVTVALMGRDGPHVALEVAAPVRSLQVQDPVAPEFLGQLLNLGGDLAAPLEDLVARGAGGERFVGVAYSPRFGSHPIGAGVSTRDQTELFDAVQEAVDGIGFVPLTFDETSSLKQIPKRSAESHKALEIEALLSDIAVAIGRNDLDDDASIQAAWASLGIDEEGPVVDAAAGAKAREKLAEVRAANSERVVRVFGDRVPSVVVVARTEAERQLLESVLKSLFGEAISISARPLPTNVHGSRVSLPLPEAKTRDRFEARVTAWRPLAEILKKTEGGSHALVQASDWYENRPDDPVNKLAGRYALASEANANVQYLRPRAAGQRGFGNYLHRVQAAVYDLVFGHAGLVSGISGVVEGTFSVAAARPTSIVGISVLTQARTRMSGKGGKLSIATRIDCETGRTTARVGWHDGEMRWSAAWEPLFEALKRIASPSIKASLGEGLANERVSFQAFVREILDDCADVGDRPLVMIDSTGAASLWPWLTDGQVGGDITLGSERLDVSRRWPGIRLVRVRTGHAARIAERKTVEYLGVETATGNDTGEVLDRYCPTITARTVRLSSGTSAQAHYWSTAGYFQMSLPRGLSVYRPLISLVPVKKAFRDAPPMAERLFAPIEISIFDVSYRLPNPVEVTVATICEGDDPDQIAHLVASLRYGYGHTASSTSLPAPLSFESKARDYMTRFALDVTDEEDDEAAEVGADAAVEELEDNSSEALPSSVAPAPAVTDSQVWLGLTRKAGVSLLNSTSLASAHLGPSGEFGFGKGAETASRLFPEPQAVADDEEPSADEEREQTWSELTPVLRLPDFVTPEWLAAFVNIPNAQLRAIHQSRDEIGRLTGYTGWPEGRPDQKQFLEIFVEGLRYPRFAPAVVQAAKRSIAPNKAQYWSAFKPLWRGAFARYQAAMRDIDKPVTSPDSTVELAEALANSGEVDLALAVVVLGVYTGPLQSELLTLIETDERFSPVREFVADAKLHLFRDDYEWDGDIRRFPPRPRAKEEAGEDVNVEAGRSRSAGNPAGEALDPSALTAVPEEPVEMTAMPPHESNAAIEDELAHSADGRSEWAQAMAAMAAASSEANEPDASVLTMLQTQLYTAIEALARYEASRPSEVEAGPYVERALNVFSSVLSVLVDAKEEAETLPSAPSGPFASTVDHERVAELDAEMETAEEMADTARAQINEAQAIMRELQMARLPEAVALKAEAVAGGREAASVAVDVLTSLKIEVVEERSTDTAEPVSLSDTATASANPIGPFSGDDDVVDPDGSTELEWDSSRTADEDEVTDERDLVAGQLDEIPDPSQLPSQSADIDPIVPQLLRRFEEFISSQRFGLAYHLALASEAAGFHDEFPLSQAELKLAAYAGRFNHAAHQGNSAIHDLLVEATLSFGEMRDDAPNTEARRIIALGALAPFALFHNDPEASAALDALRQVADGLGEAVHAFRDALAAPLRSGLSLTPSLMRLAREEAQDDEYARDLSARILAGLEDFSQRRYKFQLGNKLRVGLMKSDGELGQLHDRVLRGGAPALEATRDFATAYADRGSVLHLLEEAEVRVSTYKLTGIDGIARERMVGLIQGLASLCAEYVEAADASPAVKGMRANIQRAREGILHAASRLDDALERFHGAGPLETAAVEFTRGALASFVASINGVGQVPTATDHLAALHGHLLLVPQLDFSRGWLPTPYVPERIVGTLLSAPPPPLRPGDVPLYRDQVQARIDNGSHIAATMLISMADFYAIPAAEAEMLSESRDADMDTRRDALAAQLREARLMVDRVQRMVGAGSLDESQSLLSLLDRIDPSALPEIVPLESRTEIPEAEQILDFRAAYGLVADVRTKVETLLKRPRDALLARISSLAEQGAVAASDLDKVRGLVARDDLLTATEYLDFLENGRALPETTSPNPRFRAYFPKVPELLSAMSRAQQDAARQAIENGEEFAGLNFGRIPDDRRPDVLETLTAWNELRRSVGSGRPETEVASRLALMLDRFGLAVEIRAPHNKGNRRIYSADMRINLVMDGGSVLLPDFGSLTGGDYRVCVTVKMPNESELRAIQEDAGALRVVFFVTETVSPDRRRQLQLFCLESSNRLLVIDESMVYFGLAEPELRGLTLIELSQPFSFADPYRDYGNAAVPREMFFGRATERRKLLEPHGSCIVYGGRRLGKTALLRHIQSESNDPEAGTAVAYVNIWEVGANAAADQIWEFMARELKTIFPRAVEQSDRFSEAIRQWLAGDSKRRVLVLLDESDKFIQADASRDFPQFVQLQRLMDDTNRRFKFVLAGLHNATRLVHTENPPLKQIASDPQRIGPLMDEELGDAEALVTRPLAGMGYEFENREDVWRILSYCNYYPVLVQKFCKELVQELARETIKRRRAVSVISSDHIRLALENEHIAKEIGETFDYTIKIEDRYSLIANIVADRALQDSAVGRVGEGMSAVEVRDAAALLWPAAFVDSNRLSVAEDLLDEMEGLGVLRRVPPDRWALRSPTILRLLGHDEKIIAKLAEFTERSAPAVFEPRSMRRRLKANPTLRVQEGTISPLTLGQETDIMRDRAPVTLVFGNELADIGLVTGALASTLPGHDDKRGIVEVLPRTFPSVEAMIKDMRGSPSGEPPILHIVHHLSAWDARWVDQALRVRTVREGRARVVFVGAATHALSWIQDPRSEALAKDVKIVPLQTWSIAQTDHLLQQEQLDPSQFRGPLQEATGGYNQLMQQLFTTGSTVTAKALGSRLQATVARRRREAGLLGELGLIDPMQNVFKAMVEFTTAEITAYEIGEGPVADLGLELAGQRVVDFGVMMGLLEAQAVGSVKGEDTRPFRLNPLLRTLFAPGGAQ